MPVAWTQADYRGRNDDGSEAAATWIAAAHVSWSQKPGANFRVRFAVTESGSTSSTHTGQVQQNKNGGSWTNVTTSSSPLKAVSSTQFSDDAATTKQLATGTFVAGKMDSTGVTSATATIAQNSQTDMEYCLQIVDSAITAADTIGIRDSQNGTAFGTYTQSLVVNITKTLAPAAASLTFSAKSSATTLKLHPAAAAMTFAAITESLTLKLAPAAAAMSFSAITESLKLTVHPATATALVFTGASSTIKIGLMLAPAAASLAFGVVTSTLTEKIAPAAQALSFTGASSHLSIVFLSSAGAMTFAALTSGLQLRIHPAAATALAFTAGSSRLSFTLAPSAQTVLFGAASSTLRVTLHPALQQLTFTTFTSSIDNSGGATILHPDPASATFTAGQVTLTWVLRPASATAAFSTNISPLVLMLAPGTGILAFSSFRSSISIGTLLQPNAASAIFATSASTLLWTIRPVSQSLIFHGFSSSITNSDTNILHVPVFTVQSISQTGTAAGISPSHTVKGT